MLSHRTVAYWILSAGSLALTVSIAPARGQGCLNWEDKSPPPGERFGHALAFDSGRSVAVLFGGVLDDLRGDTWERQGTTWALRSTSGPSPRNYHAMAYDTLRGVVVLFGGNGTSPGNGYQFLGDTWEWDGTGWSLRARVGPSPRAWHSMAYDSVRGVTVLFGGDTSQETWEWDGTQWSLRSSDGPAARSKQAMSFDRDRGVVVLFGGFMGSAYSGDTWEWDGAAWSLRATNGPSPRAQHTMSYDTVRGATVLFGGTYHTGDPFTTSVFYGDTWEWNGLEWAPVVAGGPPARAGSQSVYDRARGVTVLLGGITTGNTAESITWEWDGAVWTPVIAGAWPASRFWPVLVYDSHRGRVVLFGGHGSDTSMSDTWEWDGAAWALKSATGPSARYWHAMAYDEGRHVTVLFGGEAEGNPSETWEWDGTAWSLRSTTGPSPRYWHAMAYDSARGVTVLFGGAGSGSRETWEWDGTIWTLVNTAGPAARERHTMVYDSRRGVTVLFGGKYDPGSVSAGDTWEWDGTSWSLRSETGPGARELHTMVYDGTRGVSMVFGGSGSGADRLAWEWDGKTWTPRNGLGAIWRAEHGMAYDSARGVAVMFGGVTNTVRGDTWERACNPECTEAPVAEAYTSTSGVVYAKKNRYLSFAAPSLPNGATGIALRVTLSSMPGADNCPGIPDFSAFNGASLWVGPEVRLGGPTLTGMYALQSTPYYRDWSTVPGGVIQVSDCNVVPCATYRVDAVSDVSCGQASPPSFPHPLFLATTSVWGDTVGANRTDLPNGLVNFMDVSAAVARFKDAPGTPPRTWFDLAPNNPTQGVNLSINFIDITTIVDAFRGQVYPFSGPSAPAACP